MNTNDVPRLRSIASYGPFKPRALAIGQSTNVSYSTYQSPQSVGLISATNPNFNNPNLGGYGDSNGNIAAIAGPLGVTLFHTSKPHSPLLVFHHTAPSTARPISSLEFQPQAYSLNTNRGHENLSGTNSSQSSLLACARGNGVLIWDTTGHSLSPLLGRLTIDNRGNGGGNSNMNNNNNTFMNNSSTSFMASNQELDSISSIKWKGTSSSSFDHLLTTSARSVCQWDIRCWKPRMRPSLRFPLPSSSSSSSSSSNSPSSSSSSSFTKSKFVHVSCHNHSSYSNTHLLAVMDSVGVVRIYDDRQCTIPQYEFRAHESVGVGIESIMLEMDRKKNITNTDNQKVGGWVTWGCDVGGSDNIRVWKKKDSSDEKIDPDSYWDMSVKYSSDAEKHNAVHDSFEMISEFGSSHISCARVCPSPFVNGIVTVGQSQIKTNTNTNHHSREVRRDRLIRQATMNWETKLYSLDSCCSSKSSSSSSSSSLLKTEKEQHVESKEETKQQQKELTPSTVSPFLQPPECLSSFLGGETDIYTLSQVIGQRYDMGHLIAAELALGSEDGKLELRLCCLTSTGYLLTYGLPEGSSILKSINEEAPIQTQTNYQKSTSYHAIRPSLSVNNPARATVFRRHGNENSIDPSIGVSSSEPFYKSYHSKPGALPYQKQEATAARIENKGLSYESDKGMNKEFDSVHSDLDMQKKYPTSVNSDHFSKPLGPAPKLESTATVRSNDEDTHASLLESDPIYSIAHGVEGIMQFDMDDPTHYSNRVRNEGTKDESALHKSRHSVSSASVGSAPTDRRSLVISSQGEQDINEAILNHSHHNLGQESITTNAVIDPLKAMRVPCPRLCGATFAIGDASGVLVFRNGGVSKMWSWFQKNENRRHSVSVLGHAMFPHPQQLPHDQTDPLSDESFMSNNSANVVRSTSDNQVEMESTALRAKTMIRNYPRTLLDVLKMKSAAKSAQWGGEDDNDSSDSVATTDSSSSSSFDTMTEDSDDDEDTSSDVDSKSEEDWVLTKETEKKKDPEYSMYDDYFNTPDVLRVDGDMTSISKSFDRKDRSGLKRADDRKNPESNKVNIFVSDLVDPVVMFDRRHHQILMNGQCPELANAWQFGAWWLTSEGYNPGAMGGDQLKNGSDLPNLMNMKSSVQNTGSVSSKDVSIGNKVPKSILYTTRSAKQQSMIGNIRKLFQYQHDVSSTPPPDQSLRLQRKVAPTGTKIAVLPISSDVNSKRTVINSISKSSSNHTKPSKVSQQSETLMSVRLQKQFSLTRNLCIHNANSSTTLGQTEKARTWFMLAQMLENCHRCSSDSHGLDGWGGFAGGALGRDLVANVLRYYEDLGDVQMLATIVCVLSGGEDRRKLKSKIEDRKDDVGSIYQSNLRLGSLLPDEVKRFDSYIYQYASLLYKWGLIELRAELIKHMACSLPGAGGELIISKSLKARHGKYGNQKVKKDAIIPNNGVAQGISFATMCPRCSTKCPPESNVCRKCKDYAFRCSICDNAVRGLFTVCFTCSHGGHLNHMMAWFEKNDFCPTGCGCKCTFNTFAPRENTLPEQVNPVKASPPYSSPFEAYASKSVGLANRTLGDPNSVRFANRNYL